MRGGGDMVCSRWRVLPVVLGVLSSFALHATAQVGKVSARPARAPAATSGAGEVQALGAGGGLTGAGSLLVFPEFDNRNGLVSMVTLTNTSPDEDVDIEFVYRRRFDFNGDLGCEEFNRTASLTPKDTLTVPTLFHFGFQEQGYLYVFAKDDQGQASVSNFLIGQLYMLDGLDFLDWTVNPFVFQGIGDGNLTDLDGDGIRDLDGVEYESAPDRLIMPSFFGTGPQFGGELILIDITGGTEFTTTVRVSAFNDNGVGFDFPITFSCWGRFNLQDFPALDANFLDVSGDDPSELLGAPSVEMGWFSIDGQDTTSTQVTILDPAVLAVMIDRIEGSRAAELPFLVGQQTNGHLLHASPNGEF